MKVVNEFQSITQPSYVRSTLLLTKYYLDRQYRYSFLGWLWSLLLPTLQILVYAVVFGSLFKISKKAHVLYIMTGLLPWTFLSNSIISSTQSLISRSEILKRCVIPKTMFPVADTLRNLHIFILSYVSLYLVSILIYSKASITILYLPVALVPLIVFTLAISVLCSFVAPYVRDLHEFIQVFFMVGFYTTPILYQIEMMPKEYHHLFNFNPFYLVLRPVYDVVYYQRAPQIQSFAIACFLAALTVIVSYLIYRKLRERVIFYF